MPTKFIGVAFVSKITSCCLCAELHSVFKPNYEPSKPQLYANTDNSSASAPAIY
jgi:hypothetical protein